MTASKKTAAILDLPENQRAGVFILFNRLYVNATMYRDGYVNELVRGEYRTDDEKFTPAWREFLSGLSLPAGPLYPYVGVIDKRPGAGGIFYGIETDGYIHT